jgi:hypothetical protein
VPTTRAARETRATVKRIVFVSGLITGRHSTEQSGGLLYRAEQHCVPFTRVLRDGKAGTGGDAGRRRHVRVRVCRRAGEANERVFCAAR